MQASPATARSSSKVARPRAKPKRAAETSPKRTQSRRGRGGSRSSTAHSSRSPARSTSAQRSASRHHATPSRRAIVGSRLSPIASPASVHTPCSPLSPRLWPSRLLESFSEVRKRANYWLSPRRHPGFSSGHAAAYTGAGGFQYATRVRREAGVLARLGHRVRAFLAALCKRRSLLLLLTLLIVLASVTVAFLPNRQLYQRALLDRLQQWPAPAQWPALLPDAWRDWRFVLLAALALSVPVGALLYCVCERTSRRRR